MEKLVITAWTEMSARQVQEDTYVASCQPVSRYPVTQPERVGDRDHIQQPESCILPSLISIVPSEKPSSCCPRMWSASSRDLPVQHPAVLLRPLHHGRGIRVTGGTSPDCTHNTGMGDPHPHPRRRVQ